MQRIFAYFKNFLFQSLLVGLVSLVSLSGAWMLGTQPSYAAMTSTSEETLDQVAQKRSTPENREKAYEAAAKAAQSPEKLEQEYEKNLEVFEEKHPGNSVIEGAKNLIENVTETK